MKQTREKTQLYLQNIKQEWNETIRNWPTLMMEETYGDGAIGGTSTDSDSSGPNIPVVQETVQKCLDSCNKILRR